jgi:DNA sulfur modification protein DndD
MILESLTMHNFRQFRGTQRIDFAAGPDDHNVTVVYGENGRGKTGIFRAVMYCLFGERQLSQDEGVSVGELQLANRSALEDSAPDPVDAWVQLEFSHHNRHYGLSRALRALLREESISEQEAGITLVVRDEQGNSQSLSDRAEIRKIVDGILDRRIKDYFLFDGEKIERLTRASAGQRKEISLGIRNLLNVDALEAAIRATRQVTRHLETAAAEAGTVNAEWERLRLEVERCEGDLATARDRAEQLVDEIECAETEKRDLDEKLASFNEVRAFVEERERLESDVGQLERLAETYLAEMKTRTSRTAGLLALSAVQPVYDRIDESVEKGDIPPEIKGELIERLLKDHTCICGRDLRDSSDALAHILEWKEKVCNAALSTETLRLWRSLSQVSANAEDTARDAHVVILRYAETRNTIEADTRRLELIREQIGQDRGDAAQLEQLRASVDKRLVTMKAEQLQVKLRIENLHVELQRLVAQREEQERQIARTDDLVARARLARKVRDALEEVFTGFTGEIREDIGRQASGFFGGLLDAEGQLVLGDIVVNDDYSLQIMDRWGKPFLANISAGQRQLMSIAFIAALASVASADGLLEMPLFMDTPFGRLSFEHRRNLIQAIPLLCSQWVMLATDTEFRRQEARLLEESGRWGRFYRLQSEPDGSTSITSVPASEVYSMLPQEEPIR